MPPKKPQEEQLFNVVERRGAYRTEISYEPVDLEASIETTREVSQKIGELAVEEGLPNGLENKRKSFRDKFEDKPWIPRFQYEMTLALQGLPIAIDHIAGHMARHNQATARRSYEAATGYSAQAWRILYDIEDAKLFEGDDIPSTGRIRDEFHIRLAVAEYLLAKDSMDNLHWPDRKGARKAERERRLAKIEDDLKNKSDEDLIQDWTEAKQSFRNEGEFWDEQIMSVQDSQRVKEIQSENRSRRL